MFAKATRKLVNQVDPNLISVKSVIDSTTLAPLTLVIKKENNFFSTKYTVMDYTLLDLLDIPILPEDVKCGPVIMDYSQTSLTELGAGTAVNIAAGSVGSKAEGTVTKRQSFTLKIDTVDIKNVMKRCSDRKKNDINEMLLPKLEEGEVLAAVNKIIYTSSPVTLSGSTEMEGSLGGTLKKIVGVFLKGKIKKDESCTVPERAVVAYSLTNVAVEETRIIISPRPSSRSLVETKEWYSMRYDETSGQALGRSSPPSSTTPHPTYGAGERAASHPILHRQLHKGYMLMEMCGMPMTTEQVLHPSGVPHKIMHKGYMLMEMCGMPMTMELELQPDITEDREIRTLTLKIEPEILDNTSQNSLKTLRQVQDELQKKEEILQPLAELPQSSRSALVQALCELLDNRDDLTDLENTLEKWCNGDTSDYPKAQLACDIVKLLRPVTPNQTEASSTDPPSLLKAAHLLVSAMDTLPDLIPSELTKCSPDILRSLNTLVSNLKENGQSPPGSLPLSLQDGGEFSWAAEILCSASETLEELTELWVETGVEPGSFLLALCITVQGLSMLHA
ncbi:uncharacterized protein LOC144542953 [Centroberyx gerrardi]